MASGVVTGWREDVVAGVPLLRWRGPGTVEAFVSGRAGGVSTGPWRTLNVSASTGDRPEHVRENRRRLLAAVGVRGTRTRWCRQVHGAVVHRAEAMPPLDYLVPESVAPAGDALVAEAADTALLVLAADCVPVVLARADGSAVAVCHAGWRGLVAGVVEATATALGGPAVAAVGPCAGPRRYEVGDEVAAALVARFGPEAVTAAGTADLPRCTAVALAAAGVVAVDGAERCTIEEQAFFSHRRDGSPGGRQALVAVRRAA